MKPRVYKRGGAWIANSGFWVAPFSSWRKAYRFAYRAMYAVDPFPEEPDSQRWYWQ